MHASLPEQDKEELSFLANLGLNSGSLGTCLCD